MTYVPVKIETPLMEAIKGAIVGDNEHGRYARRVLGESAQPALEEARDMKSLVRQNIPAQCEQMPPMLKHVHSAMKALTSHGLEKFVDAKGAEKLKEINEKLAQAYQNIRDAMWEAEKIGKDAYAAKQRG